MEEAVTRIASLLKERNAIDDAIAAIIGRPTTSGHLGEWGFQEGDDLPVVADLACSIIVCLVILRPTQVIDVGCCDVIVPVLIGLKRGQRFVVQHQRPPRHYAS